MQAVLSLSAARRTPDQADWLATGYGAFVVDEFERKQIMLAAI
jgi:hypothetical protein